MPTENLPANIGPYQVVGLLGRGGMGSVYKAFKPPLTKRFVAVKIIKAEFTSTPGALERFRREAALAAELKHPNIVTVYDYEEVANGDSYIVTELIEGGQTLKDRLLKGSMSLSEISDVLKQVASALDYAYNTHHIVHRDIKPSNIFLDSNRIALGDFGIAKDVNADTKLTSMGEGVGTPDYMSPEQALGEKLDNRSDIYSLGIMTFEMITGTVPFKGDTPISVVMGHIQKPVPSIRSINPSIPASLESVLSKALAKKREDRFSTASDFARAFEGASNGLPEDTTRVSFRPAANIGDSAAQQNEVNAVSQGLNLVTMLESQGRYQEAFDQLTVLQRQHPQATQINNRFQGYASQGYKVSPGFNISPPPTNYSNSGSYGGYNSAGAGGFQAPNQNFQNNQYAQAGGTVRTATPPPFTPYPAVDNRNQYQPQPPKKGSPLPFIIGGIVALVVVVAIIGVILAGGSPKPNPTPTVVAVVPTNTAAATSTIAAVTTNTTNASTTAANATPTVAPTVANTVANNTAPSKITPNSTDSTNNTPGISNISTPSAAANDQAYQLNENGNALYDKGDYAGAADKYAQAVKLKPNEPIYHNNLGLAYIKQAKYDLAVNEERLAVSLDPSKADYHNNLGVALSRQDKSSEAESEYRAAIKIDDTVSLYHSNLAKVLIDQGNYTESQSEAQTAISLDPKNDAAYSDLGQTFQYQDNPDYSQAEDNFRQALQLIPNSSVYNYELAEALYDDNKYSDAETYARKAVSLTPNDARANNSLGLALEGQKKYQEAANSYSKATTIDPKTATYFRNLANVLDDLKQFPAAQKAIASALQLEPDNARGNAIQGNIDYDQTNYKNALTFYLKAAQADPKDAYYQVDVGDTYYQLKDNTNAKKYYQAALDIDPNNQDAQDGLKKVSG